MPRYQIKAHYNPGRAVIGVVTAESKCGAMIEAEEQGLMDDPDAVDYTAHEIVPETRTPTPSGDAIKKSAQEF